MNRHQKTWVRLILLLSSVMATFLGLQMFILVDLQKYQALTTIVVEATPVTALVEARDIAGDMPPLAISTIASDPPTPEVLPSATITATPVIPTPTAIPPTLAVIVASAPLVTITQNQIQPSAAQPILPPVAVLLDNQAVAAVTGLYLDGTYLGDAVRTDRWGTTQVQAIIENGQVIEIEIVQYPNHTDRSAQISLGALPTLISESIQNQSASVDIVSRATDTSRAYMTSLASALADAAS